MAVDTIGLLAKELYGVLSLAARLFTTAHHRHERL
jgi:hypothetical protein